jgi:hypothetical protein
LPFLISGQSTQAEHSNLLAAFRPVGAHWHNFVAMATDCPTIFGWSIVLPLADSLSASLFKQHKLRDSAANNNDSFSRLYVFLRTSCADANRHSAEKDRSQRQEISIKK